MSSYSDNKRVMQTNTTEEIDLKDVFSILVRYKKSILLITLIAFFISILIAYFSPAVYESNLTLQIKEQQSSDDLMSQALGTQGKNLSNEISILHSRMVAQKVLEKMDLGTQYFLSKNFKAIELYKESPFIVKTDYIEGKFIGYEFHLTPVDATHFQLSTEPSFSTQVLNGFRSLFSGNVRGQSNTYLTKIFAYDEEIKHPLFTFTVSKLRDLEDEEYIFSVIPNKYMYGMIQSSLGVSTESEQGSLLYLSYQDNVPQRAQEVLNAVVEAYTALSIEMKSTGAQKTLDFIEEQLQDINRALQDSAKNVKEYKSLHTMINLQNKASIATENLNELEIQLRELDMQENVLNNLLNYITDNQETTGIDVGSGTATSAPILSLIDKIQKANEYYASLQADYTELHPSVIRARKQIEGLKASLKATIESSLLGTAQRKTVLLEIIKKNKLSLEALPEQEKQLSQLTRNFVVNEKVYEYLLQKQIETAIIKASTDSGVRIVDSALALSSPIKPKWSIILAIGLIIGFVLGVVQAFARNFFANTIQSITDIERQSILPIYTVLPYFKNKKSLYQDALRVLLTKFEFAEKKPKIITITSSIPGEGRTTTAIEFAKVMANSNKKVIVLDLDLRCSEVHTKLNLPNNKGMSTLLSKENQRDDVIQTLEANCDIITAGPLNPNPYSLIMSDTLHDLLEELGQKYDYIIIESPVAGLVADALVLMRLADLSLIVYKVGYSKREFITNINRFVREHQLENVGAVLNGLALKDIRPWFKK
ncbi:MAG: polysaccharide biosynthesis tyrosine autokinase [Campylobacterales bacterium]|nr:polysaccharide biosynthesis tyrosine autokinase [Campylobacterales bacterium]